MRGAQYFLVAEFTGNFNDTMKDINGVVKTLGSNVADQGTFEAILLPVGAVIMPGGELIVETAGVGPTAYTVQIGTAATPSAFLGPTTLTVAQRTSFIAAPIYPVPGDGSNVRIVIASTVANATAGKFRVRVPYTIDGKVNETVTN
jgi:hypothetical protein